MPGQKRCLAPSESPPPHFYCLSCSPRDELLLIHCVEGDMIAHICMCAIKTFIGDALIMESLVQLCRALANPQRLALVRLLALAGEQRVSAVSGALEMAQASTSSQLRVLTANGLLWQRRSGRYAFYRIARTGPPPEHHQAAGRRLRQETARQKGTRNHCAMDGSGR